MRIAAAVLVLLSACASGAGDGAVVDASQVGVPFSWAGGGFTSRDTQISPTEELIFIFENVSDRPQTAESLAIRQRNETNAPMLIESQSVRIGKMIEPGEELEVKMLVRVTALGPRPPGVPLGFSGGVKLDVLLRHADGTTYRFPIEMPMRPMVTFP